jgi:hypothetical protein
MAAGLVAGKYLHQLKRLARRPPKRIDFVVLDIDHTLIHETSAYAALEKMLGPKRAREEYEAQKKLVKAGAKSFEDVKLWGHNLQMAEGWTRHHWRALADVLFRNLHDPGVIRGIVEAKKANPELRVVLTSGTSGDFASKIAQILHHDYGLVVDKVIGSEQKYGPRGEVVGLDHFIGDKNRSRPPTISKVSALRKNVPGFDLRRTLAISDADPSLLRKAGVGLLLPVPKSRDPMSFISQKLGLFDVKSRYGAIHGDVVRELLLDPRRAVVESRTRVPLEHGGFSDALTKRVIRERLEARRSRSHGF